MTDTTKPNGDRDRQDLGVQYHVLPADDPLAALNILRAAAGLEPWPVQGHRAEMKEPRKLRPVTIEGPLRFVPVEEWAERHRRVGHHPHPTPTNENPERWDCECGGLWRILTLEQIRQKFAHLKRELRAGEQARRRAAKVEQDLRTAVPSPPRPPLRIADQYVAGPRRGKANGD